MREIVGIDLASGSSKLTGSPARLNHRPIDSLTPAFAIVGTCIVVVMKPILWGRMQTASLRLVPDERCNER